MDKLLTLDQAAELIPGADAGTLKRMIRRGTLSAYRPGKAYLTTRGHVLEAIQQCRVAPRVRISGCTPQGMTTPAPLLTPQPGLSSTEIAEAALDSALAQASKKKTKR